MIKNNANLRVMLILLALLLFCGMVFYAVSLPHHLQVQQATSGVLDMRDKDFSDNIFALSGQWEFYLGEFIAPQDFAGMTNPADTTIEIPIAWADIGYPVTGFATYRLRIYTEEPELMIFIPEIMTANVIYLNGMEIYREGTIAQTPEESRTGISSAFVPVSPKDGVLEIVAHVSNHEWHFGGISKDFLIGRTDVLLQNGLTQRMLLAVVIGMVFMAGVYHFILFLHHRHDKVYLYFGLFCLLLAVRFSFDTHSIASLLLPGGVTFPMYRIGLSTLAMQAGILFLFTQTMFGLSYGGKIRRVLTGLCLIGPVLLSWFIPFTILRPDFLMAATIPIVMSVVFALKEKVIRGNPYNVLYLASICIYLIIEPLTRITLGNHYLVASVAPTLFLILSQSIILAVSYAETKRREETLTEHTEFLDRLNQAKTEFFANASHEMRAPLTIVSVNMQTVKNIIEDTGTANENPETIKLLKNAQGEIMRLSRLVDGMLTLASINIDTDKSKLNFSELLGSIVEMHRIQALQRGIILNMEIEDSLIVFADADLLSQAVVNLIQNAIKHTKNGFVTITANQNDGIITTTVRDSGQGISPEMLPHVFERGVTDGGTGFGLHICKNVVESHGGEIGIESEPGKGTVAHFTLPVYEGQGNVK